jgi:hypothetical protein
VIGRGLDAGLQRLKHLHMRADARQFLLLVLSNAGLRVRCGRSGGSGRLSDADRRYGAKECRNSQSAQDVHLRPFVVRFKSSCNRSLANLLADCAFLLIQRSLLLLGDVAAVLAGHETLFPADLVVFFVQRCCLWLAQAAVFDVGLDPGVLIGKTLVDLGAT